jgi:membrane protease YdiL (CAAX protease family)
MYNLSRNNASWNAENTRLPVQELFLHSTNTMKELNKKTGAGSPLFTAGVFLVFCLIPMVLGATVGYQGLAGYLSPLLLLLLTFFLYKREGSSLTVLGLVPGRHTLVYLPLGLLLGAALIFAALLVQLISLDARLSFNKEASYGAVVGGLFIVLHGVLNEELIFRGYCFKHTVDRAGFLKANLLFGLLFMIWHWISWNAWGDWMVMLGSVTTAIGHLLFATALISSRTLYFAIGLHLGINWAQRNLIGVQTTGEPAESKLILVAVKEQEISTLQSAVNFGLPVLLFLLLTGLIWKYRKRDGQSKE